ncbi:MAG TPA: pyridoxal kinase PdxY [Magnetospirillum sp.]|jgi:pyridoxine kinase|nr:pyridoxal kinase PdxY [Magnetospirillum sp.]
MKILSLQSSVAYGYVGNSAAMFPLQRLGFEVIAVNTVQFSNHPGYGHWGGTVLEAEHVRAVVDGLEHVGALAECHAVLSGYLGDAATGPAVLEAVARVRAHRPQALFLCDPVMGDDTGGLYVRAGIPEFLSEQLLPAADIVTPNRFELERLSGLPAATLAEAVEAARALLAHGPRVVVATSIADGSGIACLAVTADGAWAVRTPRLPFDPPVSGAGDTLAALLLAHLMRGEDAPEALSLAVSSLYGVLDKTYALHRRELALVQAQGEIATPSRLFPPLPV